MTQYSESTMNSTRIVRASVLGSLLIPKERVLFEHHYCTRLTVPLDLADHVTSLDLSKDVLPDVFGLKPFPTQYVQ